MDFVDRHWCMHGLLVNAAGHPCAVGPVVVQIPNDRCRTRWMLVHDSNWIGFISNVSVLRNNMELVKRSFVEAGQKSFPDARTSPRSELVRPSVPAIEISNDRNFARIGSAHAKACALLPIDSHDMCAELFVNAVMAALVEEVEVVIAE